MVAPSVSPAHARPSRPIIFLGLLWALLGVWVVAAFVRGESLRDDDVALPVLAFLMASAVIGSRLWLLVHERHAKHHPPPSVPS